VGPRAGLDRSGKFRLHRDSIPGPSSPYPVAIPTELPGPRHALRDKPFNLMYSMDVNTIGSHSVHSIL